MIWSSLPAETSILEWHWLSSQSACESQYLQITARILKNNVTTKEKSQKQINLSWFTPDSFFQRDPLVSLIPCQMTSRQCHRLQPSNNDVTSSLLYFCKARSFTQKNKYRWPIERVCFVLILKKRPGGKKNIKAFLSVTMII